LTERPGEGLSTCLSDRQRNTLFGNKDGRASNHPGGAHWADRLAVVVRVELYALGKMYTLSRCSGCHGLTARGAL